jgi:hypothetical protein
VPRRYTRREAVPVRDDERNLGWQLRLDTNAGVPSGTYTLRNLRTGETATRELGPNRSATVVLGGVGIFREVRDGAEIQQRGVLRAARPGDRVEVSGPDGYRFQVRLPDPVAVAIDRERHGAEPPPIRPRGTSRTELRANPSMRIRPSALGAGERRSIGGWLMDAGRLLMRWFRPRGERQTAGQPRREPTLSVPAASGTPRRYTRRETTPTQGDLGIRGWRVDIRTNAGVPAGRYTFRNARTGDTFTRMIEPDRSETVLIGGLHERAPHSGELKAVGQLPGSVMGDRIQVTGPEGYRYELRLPRLTEIAGAAASR